MTLEDYKQIIVTRTGIPSDLLTGETVEENIAQAKALLAYKRGCEQNKIQNTREQFKEWAELQMGIEPQNTAEQALAEIEKGSSDPEVRTTKDQFIEWLNGL